MKTFVGLFAGGTIAILIFKLLATLLFPLMGMFLGLVMSALKVLLIVGVGYVVYSLVFKRRKEPADA